MIIAPEMGNVNRDLQYIDNIFVFIRRKTQYIVRIVRFAFKRLTNGAGRSRQYIYYRKRSMDAERPSLKSWM